MYVKNCESCCKSFSGNIVERKWIAESLLGKKEMVCKRVYYLWFVIVVIVVVI